jgi:hypothetical protein
MAEEAATNARYRPYRLAVWVVYFVILMVFSLSITVSVFRSVWSMTPAHQTVTGSTLSEAECLDRARALWNDLEDRRTQMTNHSPVSDVDSKYWAQFRVEWLARQRVDEAACTVVAPDRVQLRQLFVQLDRVMDLYTTHVVQFAGEVGPSVDKLKNHLVPGK